MIRRLHRPVEQATIRADLPDGGPGSPTFGVDQIHTKESRVGAIHHAEAVAPRLDLQIRPRAAVHDDGVAEVLGNPVGMDEWIGWIAIQTLAIGCGVREVPLAVGVELAVLEDQLDLLITGRQAEWIPDHTRVVLVAHKVHAGQPGQHADAGHAQGVVVEPQRGRGLRVGIAVECRVRVRLYHTSVGLAALAVGGPPRVWDAVVLGFDLGPMQVHHARLWARVRRSRRGRARGMHAKRICPVDRLIDAERVLQDRLEGQSIHVFDGSGNSTAGDNGRRRVLWRVGSHLVAPHVRAGFVRRCQFGVEAVRQNLLLELQHPNLQARGADALVVEGRQRLDELWDGVGSQSCLTGGGQRAGHIEQGPALAIDLEADERANAHCRADADELSPGCHDAKVLPP